MTSAGMLAPYRVLDLSEAEIADLAADGLLQ